MILWLRKSLRLIGLLFPAAALLLGRWWGVGLVVFFLVLVVPLEAARLTRPRVNDWVYRKLRAIFKEKERRRPSGMAHFLVAALVCLAFFPLGPGAAAVAFQAVGDAAAEIAGTRGGRIRLHGPKTLEGSAACLASCLALVPVLALPYERVWGLPNFAAAAGVLAAGAVAATLTELAVLEWDDNLWMPPASAAAMWAALRLAA